MLSIDYLIVQHNIRKYRWSDSIGLYFYNGLFIIFILVFLALLIGGTLDVKNNKKQKKSE